MKIAVLILIFALFGVNSQTWASSSEIKVVHSGRTDKNGCHAGSRSRHCHNGETEIAHQQKSDSEQNCVDGKSFFNVRQSSDDQWYVKAYFNIQSHNIVRIDLWVKGTKLISPAIPPKYYENEWMLVSATTSDEYCIISRGSSFGTSPPAQKLPIPPLIPTEKSWTIIAIDENRKEISPDPLDPTGRD